jgi:hypothetical protein
MARTRAEDHWLAKLVILIALAIVGQLVARWIAGRYVVNLGAPAQNASIAVDLVLLACVPFGYLLAPRLSIRVLPLLDDDDFSRTLFRSLVLALVSLAAAIAVSLIPHARASAAGMNSPIPFPLSMVLAIAAAFREEIEFRLGLLTVLAQTFNSLLYKIMRGNRSPSLWIANIAQAMAFGALHQVAGFTGRTSTLSFTSVMFEPRMVSGLVLGYAYMHYGLETAILAHAIGDGAIFALASLSARS